MIFSSHFPQMIYIDDDKTIEFIKKEFGIESNLKIGDWFNCNKKNLVLKNEYIVKPLDTFSSVAKALNISEQQVRSAANTKNLFIGQKIVF
ncbi:MAG: LysM peptidoglycan-binding domain-containing protein [Clostridiales bacterium]|nr:LysM peptidoglycan-binding domain-containing protein [Clostridiales bacterium]